MSTDLDPQAERLLAEMADEGALPAHALSVAGTRANFAANFVTEEPFETVGDVRDEEVPGPDGGVSIRIYTPEGTRPFPVLVYAHGGGWVRGSVETHDNLCRALCNETGFAVVSVDYRRPPEHPFPAALRDTYAVAEWVSEFGDLVHADPDRLVVGGDSAGGNLAAATAILARERDGPSLDHQLLLYPVLDYMPETESYREFGEKYIPSRDAMEWYWEKYLETDVDARNPCAAPLQVRDTSGLPPATILTAGHDPLRDEGRAYAERLRDSGVDVEYSNYEGQIHGFLGFPDRIDRAADARSEIADSLRESVGR